MVCRFFSCGSHKVSQWKWRSFGETLEHQWGMLPSFMLFYIISPCFDWEVPSPLPSFQHKPPCWTKKKVIVWSSVYSKMQGNRSLRWFWIYTVCIPLKIRIMNMTECECSTWVLVHKITCLFLLGAVALKISIYIISVEHGEKKSHLYIVHLI